MSDSFDALVLLTSVPSETSILSKYGMYNIKHSLKKILNQIYPYTNLFLKTYYSSSYLYFF